MWARVDRQGVDVAAHQFSGGSIDHSMSLYPGDTFEGRRDDGDVKMPALARAGMAGVFGAVVANFEQGRMERLLERGAQPFDPRAHTDSPGPAESGDWRRIQKMTPRVNANASGIITNDLKLTQASWLML